MKLVSVLPPKCTVKQRVTDAETEGSRRADGNKKLEKLCGILKQTKSFQVGYINFFLALKIA